MNFIKFIFIKILLSVVILFENLIQLYIDKATFLMESLQPYIQSRWNGIG
jgi:hypothetical protein